MTGADLLIAWAPGEVRGVLRVDGRPVELLVERHGPRGLLDAIFLGRIARVVPSLPGAFIDIGEGPQIFIPGDDWPPEGAILPVQIVKEAQGDKPPRGSRALSLHGRLGVWTPGQPGLAVSRKLDATERARLSEIARTLLAEGEGLVLRSHAAGADATEIAQDVTRLRRRHDRLIAATAQAKAPARLEAAPEPIARLILRAAIRERLMQILIDDAEITRAAKAWCTGENADLAATIRHDPGLDDLDIDALFDQAVRPMVALPGGGNIIIETVTAATIIDVNLGRAAEGARSTGDAVLAVNLAAAAAVGREIRLRNLGGSIIVDFITMRRHADRQSVEAALRQAVAGDATPVAVLGWTRLDHLELSRRRESPSLAEIMLAPPPPARLSAESTACAILSRLARARIAPGAIVVRTTAPVLTLLQGDLGPAFTQARARAGRKVMLELLPGDDIERYDIVGV